MAGIRDDRRRLKPVERASGVRSPGVLVLALIAVLAAIALLWNISQRSVHRVAPFAPTETPSPPPPAAGPPAPAVAPAAIDEPPISARKQSEIARVVKDGSPGLKNCYQRALVRDDSLVHGNVIVHVSVAPSGKADTVRVSGPAGFRAMQPCFEETISRWAFPTASEPYATEFPLVLQGRQ
jgi:outer membrane biosynthesis protein TonB